MSIAGATRFGFRIQLLGFDDKRIASCPWCAETEILYTASKTRREQQLPDLQDKGVDGGELGTTHLWWERVRQLADQCAHSSYVVGNWPR